MATIPNNRDPGLAHRGIPFYAPAPAASMPPATPSIRSPLVDALPTYEPYHCGARELVIDPATAPALVAGQNAGAYGLLRINVDADTGGEIALAGFDIQLLPADVNGTAVASAGTVTAWGNNTGTASAIIVGANLPITPQGWIGGIWPVPGLDLLAGSPSLRVADNSAQYLCVQGFPTGAISDAAPNKPNHRYMSGATLYRVTRGQTLDVAFLLTSTQYTAIRAAGTRVLVMHVDVVLKIVPYRNLQVWGG